MKEKTSRKDEEAGEEESSGARPSLVLRAIDACLRPLHRWRDSIEPPTEDGDAVEDEVSAAPVRKSLLHRTLVVLMCVLIGGGIGGFIAYRGFSKALDANKDQIERLRDDLADSNKDAQRSEEAKAKYQNEALEYRKTLRETELELQTAKTRIQELDRQLQALKPAPPPKPAASGRSAAGKPAVRRKTGICVTGTANTAAELQQCLDKFNSP